MAQYSVDKYFKIGSVTELERRFNLLKILIPPYKEHINFVRRILDDPEWGKLELKEWEERLQVVVEDMKNIIEAINLLGVQK